MRDRAYPKFFCKAFKKILFVLISCGLLLFYFQVTQANPKQFVLVIDPGHGGNDPGSVGKHSFEKDIVLGVALKLGNYIKKNLPEVKVIYTRETDIFIPLDQRAEIANKNKAELFISIHANSSKNPNPFGVETFLMGDSKEQSNLEVAKAENAVILKEDNYSTKYGGYDPNSPETFMIFSLIQNKYHTQSLNFATAVQSQFKKGPQRFDRGVKQAGFLVLWKTAMPSVLVETGFISNATEEKYITSPKGQDALAMSIFKAFHGYYNNHGNKSITVSIPESNLTPTSDTAPELKPESENPVVLDTIPDSLAALPKIKKIPHTDISFLIQISSSRKPLLLHSKKFKGLKNIEELKDGKTYKYAVGRKSTYAEVQDYSSIVKRYFPDAFIIATRNRKIISVAEALKEIKD